jgi:hypothetical protein
MKEKKVYNIDPQVKVAMLMKAPDTDLLNVAISDTGMQPLAASQHSLGAYLEHSARTMNERISVAAIISALCSEVTHKKQFIL